MSTKINEQSTAQLVSRRAAMSEPRWMRRLLIGLALLFIGIFLMMPLAVVFAEAFRKGAAIYLNSIREAETLAAIRLTLFTTFIVIILNVLFGVAASWSIAKFDFFGKNLLLTLIDLPFSVSPVIAGLIYVMLFGLQGLLGPWLDARNLKIIFSTPGILLATIFVTFPFVARELIAVMEIQGNDEEEAAIVLGAGGWKTFWRITLPNIKWGLLYGVLTSNARAMGEFGAVSVVSGHIRGLTNTMTLHVEILYNEYRFEAAFAVASLLTLLALVTLVARKLVEWRTQKSPALEQPVAP